MSVARFRVSGRMDMASRPSFATVTIDRQNHVFSVRPFRRKRTYSIPLSTVAEMVVRNIIMAEVREKNVAKKKRRTLGRRRL